MEELSSQVPPSAPKRKRRGKGPLVESEVRRSPRMLSLMLVTSSIHPAQTKIVFLVQQYLLFLNTR
jgi:hypothetical protein